MQSSVFFRYASFSFFIFQNLELIKNETEQNSVKTCIYFTFNRKLTTTIQDDYSHGNYPCHYCNWLLTPKPRTKTTMDTQSCGHGDAHEQQNDQLSRRICNGRRMPSLRIRWSSLSNSRQLLRCVHEWKGTPPLESNRREEDETERERRYGGRTITWQRTPLKKNGDFPADVG